MNGDTYHLYKWSVICIPDPYRAPEAQEKRLTGFRDDEARAVLTGPIVKVDGKTITTWSGSIYYLEDIDPDYLKWMEDNGIIFDSENPIKIKKMP